MDRKEIAKVLFCFSIVEEKVADAYGTLSRKADMPMMRTLLEYISLDSRKHAVLFKGLAEVLSEEAFWEEECSKFLGESGRRIMEAAERIGEADIGDLPDLVEKMATLESFAGEEYLAMIQLKTLRLVAEKEGIDLDSLNRLLDWTVRDEERHETVVKLAAEIVGKNHQNP